MALPAGPLAFWLLAAAMAGGALAFLLPSLLRRRPPSRTRTQGETNLAVYRQALAEVDRDVERGLLPASERWRARAELVDRAASDAVGEAEAPARADRAPILAALLALALPAFAFGLYGVFGDPGAMDADMRRHLAAAPRDARGWVLLARSELERERYAEAAAAFERAVAASRTVAQDPAVWCEYADAVGMAQGRRLAGKPAELIARAQALNPLHPCALEMAGSLAYERAEYASASRHWRQLLEQVRGNDAARRELQAAIARADRLAR